MFVHFRCRAMVWSTSSLLAIALSSASWAQNNASSGGTVKAQPVSSTPATPPASAPHVHATDAALLRLIDAFEPYHKEKEIKGAAVLSGSTTMVSLGKAWSDRFRQFHPEVTFTRGADGTDAGIKSLAKDPTIIAGSSRPLNDADIAMLKSGKCKEPISLIVALDPLALYVHKDNPVEGVTPEQLEAIFRAPGGKRKHVDTWGELGVTGDLASQKIRIHSRSEISGTTAFIKQLILSGDEMAEEVQTHASNEEVSKAVGSDKAGVGFGGLDDGNDQVRAVPLILGNQKIPATEQSFLAGSYPLVHPLVLVIDKTQLNTDGGLREAVLRYIFSRDGQLEAVRAGFFPVDPGFIRHQLDLVRGPQMR